MSERPALNAQRSELKAERSTLNAQRLTLNAQPRERWWAEEQEAWTAGYECVAGIDEAGRGALAGPVVAACVILPREADVPGLDDSKALTPAQREQVYTRIARVARGYGVGIIEARRIDEINILRATHEAMRSALDNLTPGLFPDVALIDGLPVIPFPLNQIALVRGDTRSASIAAASIVAKVTRDRLMCAHDALFPGYGFAGHKGYGAPTHLNALRELGPCALHRRTFRPVAEALGAPIAPRAKRSRPSEEH